MRQRRDLAVASQHGLHLLRDAMGAEQVVVIPRDDHHAVGSRRSLVALLANRHLAVKVIVPEGSSAAGGCVGKLRVLGSGHVFAGRRRIAQQQATKRGHGVMDGSHWRLQTSGWGR